MAKIHNQILKLLTEKPMTLIKIAEERDKFLRGI